LKVELIPVSTNGYSFFQFRVNWGIAYSPPLIGTVMQIERLLHTFYKPSGRTILDEIKGGLPETGTVTDHLLSTENLKISLHDPSISRFEKIRKLQNFTDIRNTLRVCTKAIRPTEHINCCSCGKCLLNMSYFELLGNPNQFSSFHRQHHPLLLFQWLRYNLDGFVRLKDIVKLSWEKRRWGFWLISVLIYFPAWIKHQLYRMYLKLIATIPPDLKYSVKTRIYPHNE
jgi:hypothetical protein